MQSDWTNPDFPDSLVKVQYFHRLVLKKCSLIPNGDADDNNIETVWRG